MPAYFGAEPWMGSNIETWPGWMLPEAADAHAALQHRAQVGDDVAEHVARVTTTSNHSGFFTIHMQAASM